MDCTFSNSISEAPMLHSLCSYF